ncbi:MAG: hypothetical protein AAF242_16220 [Bacteroidota bacterium]
MNRIFLFIAFFIGLNVSTFSQAKKQIDIPDFAIWNQIQGKLISNDGNWITYTVAPGEGNKSVMLYDAKNKKTISFERSSRSKFSADNQFLIFTIAPDVESVKEMRRAGKSKKDLPKDTLGIYNISSGSLEKVAGAEKVSLPEKWAGWLFYKKEIEIGPDRLGTCNHVYFKLKRL